MAVDIISQEWRLPGNAWYLPVS